MQNEDSQASIISTNSEVDRQLTAMMNENSLDFTSKFRQLAKHVTSTDQFNNTWYFPDGTDIILQHKGWDF